MVLRVIHPRTGAKNSVKRVIRRMEEEKGNDVLSFP